MALIQENINLKAFNTFGMDVNARYFAVIASEEDLVQLLSSEIYKNEKHLILGGGSNILFTEDYSGLVIKNELKGFEKVYEDDEKIELKVMSGEGWHDLVMLAVENNWSGIENLSLIPGTVGAAPMQNIGAYGVEVKDCIKSVRCIDLKSGEWKTFRKEECEFGYRESIFKHTFREKFFISSVTLTLRKKNHQLNTSYGALHDVINTLHEGVVNLQTISKSVIHIRKSKLPDPTVVGNAGSFFKNPTIPLKQYTKLKKSYPLIPGYISENQEVKVPAGWLIENCGWKGKKENDVGVHPQQALVLVNYGNGNGKEIFDLAMKIKSSVEEKFFITLIPEVNII